VKVKAETADQLHRAYLFATFAVLWAAAAVVAAFAWIWTGDLNRQPLVPRALLAFGLTGIALTTLGLLSRIVVHQARSPLRGRFRIVGLLAEGASWGAVAALGMLVLTGAYVGDLLSPPSREWQIAAFWRAMSVTNGLSILLPLGLLMTSFYIWALWNMRRLKMQTYDRGESSVFYDLLTGRDPAVKPKGGHAPSSFRRRLRWSTLEIASWDRLRSQWGLVPVALGILLIFLARDRFTTVDGLAAGWLLWWCSLWGLVLGADAIARTADQGAVLLEALRRLKTHPISDAFERVSSRPLEWQFRLSPLRQLALAPLICDMRMLDLRLRPRPTPVDDAFAALREVGSASDWDSATPIAASEQWAVGTKLVEAVYAQLSEQHWIFETRARPVDPKAGATMFDAAEDVVAYCTAFIVRNLLVRVIAGLSAGLSIIGLVGLAHLFYSFQGRHFWLTLDLTCFILATVVACRLLLKFERDKILSALWKTAPDRVSWTGGFIYRIGITAAVPIILLIASFFPEVAGSLGSLIEPLQKALP